MKGFPRNGAVDLDALQTVIELRSKYGRPERTLGVPSDYYDPSFVAEAVPRTAPAPPAKS